ncbi:haloacid dehalogenase, type II [Aspergillus japonicus CBS 114.51]|uniref:Haloacid dehalogenase, type II n=2 Tax=Aspergillus TaxID=5052 RepID=A0A2V5HUF6_ASPV1|nr:haloacid dehalogenase, type II [Aspergillus japonicus CBS 114.51]PYI15537.1 haloacid dehalogenase, type II [Aspergillus violaceofuscus CBS 115571]RAH76328.1 haloacid dehalogenase, type II [Aspergillus japonicus CBS 114.51]
MANTSLLKGLFFDVFGTVVEWRDCVASSLREAAERALRDPKKTLSLALRARATAMSSNDWQELVEEWRASYGQFTRTFDPSQAFISIDEHHFDSIQKLLHQHDLKGLFTEDEQWELVFCWHRLEPWPDSVKGLELLNRRFRTCTLSNGNVSLLRDLQRHGSLPFTDIVSAQHFGAYKPSPQVYTGAAKRFGLDPCNCAMVAAHLYDLKAAKALGFATIYVERNDENLTPQEIAQAKEQYVDEWVDGATDGLIEVARRLGIHEEPDLASTCQ